MCPKLHTSVLLYCYLIILVHTHVCENAVYYSRTQKKKLECGTRTLRKLNKHHIDDIAGVLAVAEDFNHT